ncbi:MAG: SDR family oxidoreductase [Armatimonadota bacterium]
MPGPMDGKVAIVTGGAAGIGKATAIAFSREGAQVMICDVNEEIGLAAAREITDAGSQCYFVKTDVSKASDVVDLVNHTVETFGRLDYACNNAGIEGERASTAECSEENWDRIIDINLKGVWLCMKYEIPQMLKQGGAIVNVSSIAALVGFSGLPAYCASKGGINQLTKTAALEYARQGIRVNCICPGAIRTTMLRRLEVTDPEWIAGIIAAHPIGRLGTPEEVGNLIVWLCSERSSFITGCEIPIDGGYVAQ